MSEDQPNSQPTSSSSQQHHYITYAEHRKFMADVESELISICNSDTLLSGTVVPLLTDCPNDTSYTQLTTEYLNSVVDHHYGRKLKVKIYLFDNQSCDIFVPQNGTLLDLRKSIEHCLSLRIQREVRKAKRNGNNNSKIFKKINWKHVWQKYDLLVDKTRRVRLRKDPTIVATGEKSDILDIAHQMNDCNIVNESIIEFVLKRV